MCSSDLLVALFGFRVITSRFRFGPAFSELAPSLLSIGFGMLFGLATWPLGPWGPPGALADAALPPPYTGEVFLGRLVGWVKSFQPIVLVPLVLLAIGWTVATARRERDCSRCVTLGAAQAEGSPALVRERVLTFQLTDSAL